MPNYATTAPSATPDPNATPTPQPVANPAALSSSGNLTVSNVPAVSENGTFTVYGTTDAYAIVTATVEVKVEPTPRCSSWASSPPRLRKTRRRPPARRLVRPLRTARDATPWM